MIKKILGLSVVVLMLSGCYIPAGHYKVTRVEVRSTHGGEWREVAPGVYRPGRVAVRVCRRPRRDCCVPAKRRYIRGYKYRCFR